MELEAKIWEALEETLDQMVSHQQEALLALGRRVIPQLTSDDILQPNDYLELENHPHFRYEEGILAGILSVQMAIQAIKKS